MATIAEILLAQGRAAAQNRRAQGQIWGNAIQQLGQIPAQVVEQRRADEERAANTKLRGLQTQEAEMNVAAAKQQAADRAALDTAMGSGLDPDVIERSLVDQNMGHLVPTFRKSWNDAETARANLQKAKTDAQNAENDYLGALAAGVKPFLTSPDKGVGAATIALQHAKELYPDVDQLLQQIQQQPDMLPQLVDSLIAKSPSQQKVIGEAEDRALRRDTEKRQAETAAAGLENQRTTNARLEATLEETKRHDKAMEARPVQGGLANQTEWAIDPRDGVTKLLTKDEIRQLGAKQPATTDMRNKEAGRGLVSRSIGAIEKMSNDIITKVGPAQRADAMKRGTEAVFGNDPSFRTYQDARMALAGNLAVAQQGSRPSDADIKAIWLPLVPDAYRDTAESAAMKWGLIKTMSGQGGEDATPQRQLAQPRVGDIVTVKGQRVRVTKIGPNGQLEGTPVR